LKKFIMLLNRRNFFKFGTLESLCRSGVTT
jgi:hypothetical protein